MSGATKDDVYKLLGYIQDDLRQTQAKLVEVRSMLASGAMERTPGNPHPLTCRQCKAGFRGERELAFHVANVHAGPPVPLSPEEVAG